MSLSINNTSFSFIHQAENIPSHLFRNSGIVIENHDRFKIVNSIKFHDEFEYFGILFCRKSG